MTTRVNFPLTRLSAWARRWLLPLMRQPANPAAPEPAPDALDVTIGGMALTIPAALLPFRPLSHYNFEYELYVGLRAALQPGMTVFDMGSYCGVMTALAARLVGAGGQVHLFEASYESFERARVMLQANRLEQVTALNAFVGQTSGEERTFYLVRSSEGWAVSSADASICELYPQAEALRTPVLAVDDYCARSGVRPDVVKMDIEGAEYIALLGMQRLLAEHPPVIVLEIHGDRMPGIGGSTAELLDMLAGRGYTLTDLFSGETLDAPAALARYPVFGHLLCWPGQMPPKRRAELMCGVADLAEHNRRLEAQRAARALVDTGKLEEALPLLEALLVHTPYDAELLYLKAFCLHQRSTEWHAAALECYHQALANGFDEFWVRYNRAALLYSMGRRSDALEDAVRAVSLNPQHTDAQRLKNLLAHLPGEAGARQSGVG